MGRQVVAARYRRRSGAHLHTHLTTLVGFLLGATRSGADTAIYCSQSTLDTGPRGA
jgi:hypothetical protein